MDKETSDEIGKGEKAFRLLELKSGETRHYLFPHL
jgi:hypothetical protein